MGQILLVVLLTIVLVCLKKIIWGESRSWMMVITPMVIGSVAAGVSIWWKRWVYLKRSASRHRKE